MIGIGTIAVGGGAIGSGAFSTVEADRDVDIETAGDSEALLAMEVDNDTLEGEDGETIAFDLEENLNLNAVTVFEDALSVTNNGDDVVDLEITDSDDDERQLLVDSQGDEMYFENSEVNDNTMEIGSEETVQFDVGFNLEGYTNSEDADDEIPEGVTFVATEQD